MRLYIYTANITYNNSQYRTTYLIDWLIDAIFIFLPPWSSSMDLAFLVLQWRWLEHRFNLYTSTCSANDCQRVATIIDSFIELFTLEFLNYTFYKNWMVLHVLLIVLLIVTFSRWDSLCPKLHVFVIFCSFLLLLPFSLFSQSEQDKHSRSPPKQTSH